MAAAVALTRAERQALRDHNGASREVRGIVERLKRTGKRFCRGCDRIKPLTAFYVHKTRGHQYRCKSCARAARAGIRKHAAPYKAPSGAVVAERKRNNNAAYFIRVGAARAVVREMLERGQLHCVKQGAATYSCQ